MPRVRVPRHVARHVARLVTWLVAPLVTPLVVDYFTSRRLIVDYFAYASRLGASARRTACRAAHRRLLRQRRAFECLGTSRGSSRGSSSTTSTMPRVRVPRHVARLVTRLVVLFVVNFEPRVRVPRHVAPLLIDYFAYAARPGALARRAARHRLLRFA
jgi:hypothetical protein